MHRQSTLKSTNCANCTTCTPNRNIGHGRLGIPQTGFVHLTAIERGYWKRADVDGGNHEKGTLSSDSPSALCYSPSYDPPPTLGCLAVSNKCINQFNPSKGFLEVLLKACPQKSYSEHCSGCFNCYPTRFTNALQVEPLREWNWQSQSCFA